MSDQQPFLDEQPATPMQPVEPRRKARLINVAGLLLEHITEADLDLLEVCLHRAPTSEYSDIFKTLWVWLPTGYSMTLHGPFGGPYWLDYFLPPGHKEWGCSAPHAFKGEDACATMFQAIREELQGTRLL